MLVLKMQGLMNEQNNELMGVGMNGRMNGLRLSDKINK